MQNAISRATLGRLPLYLRFVRSVEAENISATQIARGLGLGEVQVRKDLASVCRAGQPKVGYPAAALRRALEKALCLDAPVSAVIVGAGRLGSALMEYDGFREYGMNIAAAFDRQPQEASLFHGHIPVYPMEDLAAFCASRQIRVGILSVPAASAQEAADEMVKSGIAAILNLAPVPIRTPPHVTVRQEDFALSLAYLNFLAGAPAGKEEDLYENQDF